MQYLSAFAAETNLSHKEELANHPDLPDPTQFAAEAHRLLKSFGRCTQKEKCGHLQLLCISQSIQLIRRREGKKAPLKLRVTVGIA